MTDRGAIFINGRVSPLLRQIVSPATAEVLVLVFKLLWAAAFGILLLLAIILTRLVWNADWPIARYDALVLFAVFTQLLFLLTRMETLEEAKVIFIFHILGTAMEVFKLAQGSWDYPDQGVLEIGGVPLFSGFMYASVGSFIARSIRIFNMTFAPYPPFWSTCLLAMAIYANFITHHFTYDIRWILFVATFVMFWRTRIWFYPDRERRWLPVLVAPIVAAWFLWIAENVGTLTQTWTYAGQAPFELVSLSKFGSWYLLLYVSFVSVSLILSDALRPHGDR